MEGKFTCAVIYWAICKVTAAAACTLNPVFCCCSVPADVAQAIFHSERAEIVVAYQARRRVEGRGAFQ